MFRKSLFYGFYYRPQTNFAKVMFSQVSVCPRGVYATHTAPGPEADTPVGRRPPQQTPAGRHPPDRQPPQADTPQQTPPQADIPPVHAGIHPPWADTPSTVHAGIHPPPCPVHAGIWSKSGWYASHWNAFLFHL